MLKTPPFHVFHPPSRSLAPRISHQSLPVSTSSVASAKEEPITTSPSHQVPKTPSLHVTKSLPRPLAVRPLANRPLKTAVSAHPKTTCKRVRCRVLERPRR